MFFIALYFFIEENIGSGLSNALSINPDIPLHLCPTLVESRKMSGAFFNLAEKVITYGDWYNMTRDGRLGDRQDTRNKNTIFATKLNEKNPTTLCNPLTGELSESTKH